MANCDSKQDGYETANLVSQWTGWLQEECRNLRLHWDEIAPENFGRPPGEPDIKIFVDGSRYSSAENNLKMQMSQERMMHFFEGTNIYRDKYVGIREILQNAVDASLLQLWKDIIQNGYLGHGVSKNNAKNGLKLTDFLVDGRYEIFANYDIAVEVIKDLQNNQILLIVKDKGIGISSEDVKYIADIGSGKENNIHLRRLMDSMPEWLRPSGVFGIGLQSVFQLTDCIEFYTRQHNQPERRIALYSYGKNKGRIDVYDVPPNEDGMMYHDNTVPGTNVMITIDPHKMIEPEKKCNHFQYYDTEFDVGEEIDIAYAEICRVCKNRIRSVKCDYFNMSYLEIVRDRNGKNHPGEKTYPRRSYFLPEIDAKGKKELPFAGFGETIKPLIESKGEPYRFSDNAAYYWDENTQRCYFLKIRPCKIGLKDNDKQVFLPETVQSMYRVSYKFNEISNTETIYHSGNHSRDRHAGFLEWHILILDGKPERYLNIDRDRLREDAISEEELLEIRGPILQKWCKYFCELDKKKQENNRFEKSPGTLLSLVLLFYQNVPAEQFGQFIAPYRKYLDKKQLVVGTEHIPVTYFWDSDKLFQAEVPLPRKFVAFESDMPGAKTQNIKPETLCHFPHRLVQIASIHSSREGKLIYRLRFGPSQNPHTIRMSETARLFDYMQVFDPYANQPERVSFFSIQKKVFKPDDQYPHLAIPCFPHTFSRGENFFSHLDCCIRWYILSPFDLEAAKILRMSIEGDQYMVRELMESVRNSAQLQKCVRYVLMKRYGDSVAQEQIRQDILKEYVDFAGNLYESLYKNRMLVREQFQKGEV